MAKTRTAPNKGLGTILGAIALVLIGGWLLIKGSGNGKVTITMTSTGFAPSETVIRTGQTIEFYNQSQSDRWPASNIHPTHEIYPEFDPGRPILPGQNWSFKFDKPGLWRLHDHLFPDMIGSVTVR